MCPETWRVDKGCYGRYVLSRECSQRSDEVGTTKRWYVRWNAATNNRSFSPVSVDRKTVNDYKFTNGLCVPAGTMLSIPVYNVHRDEVRIYTSPVVLADHRLPRRPSIPMPKILRVWDLWDRRWPRPPRSIWHGGWVDLLGQLRSYSSYNPYRTPFLQPRSFLRRKRTQDALSPYSSHIRLQMWEGNDAWAPMVLPENLARHEYNVHFSEA